MKNFDDGWAPTPYKKQKRKRGGRCATKRVKYFFFGDKITPVFFKMKCFNRVERGQKYCVKCLAVHRKLKELGKAPRRKD